MSNSQEKLLELLHIIEKRNKTNQITPSMSNVIEFTKEKKNSKYVDYLKELLKVKNAKQMIHEIITKLHLPEPIYDFTEDIEFKWRCNVKINEKDIIADGFNNKKGEAKKIASEQLIIVLLNSEEHGEKLREIIKKDFFKLLSKEQSNEDEVDLERPEADANNKLEVNNVNSVKTAENIYSDKYQLQFADDNNQAMIITEDLNIQNNVVLSGYNTFEQKVILDFEIFCFKWERYLIVDRQFVKITDILYDIKKCFNDKLKSCKISKVGSLASSTLRCNFLYIDAIAEIEVNDNISIGDCCEWLNSLDSFKKKNYISEIKTNEINLYHSQYNQFLFISNKDLRINLYFFQTKSHALRNILDHQKWIRGRNCSDNIENIILTKILKSWRREKGLVCLKPELIEILSMKNEINSQCILIRLVEIFETILNGCLFPQKSNSFSNIFESDYQLDFIKDLSMKNIFDIQSECVKAINNLKEGNFSELF